MLQNGRAGAISTTATTEIPDLNEVGNTHSRFLALLNFVSLWMSDFNGLLVRCLCCLHLVQFLPSVSLGCHSCGGLCPNGSSISRLIECCWRVRGSVVLFREGPVIRATVLGGRALSCLFYQGLALGRCCCGQLPFRDVLTANQLTPSQMALTGIKPLRATFLTVVDIDLNWINWPHLKWLIIEAFMGSHI